MSKIRKRISFLVMLSMLLCVLSVPSFAGNQTYSFYLGNTGREFQRDTQSSNQKTNINSGWVYNVQSIGFFWMPKFG